MSCRKRRRERTANTACDDLIGREHHNGTTTASFPGIYDPLPMPTGTGQLVGS